MQKKVNDPGGGALLEPSFSPKKENVRRDPSMTLRPAALPSCPLTG